MDADVNGLEDMPMLSLYLVRHGQTDLSRQNRFCGTLDPPLTELGTAMAAALAQGYGDTDFQAIYSSPLERALATAAPTASRTGLTVIVEAGLREISYGEWEGRLESAVEKEDPIRFGAWSSHPGRVAPPGGESGDQIAARALPVIESIASRYDQGKVLVVSHKATLRVLLCALLGIDLDQFRTRIGVKVAAVSIVDFRSTGPLLRLLGDESHLPPRLKAADGT